MDQWLFIAGWMAAFTILVGAGLVVLRLRAVIREQERCIDQLLRRHARMLGAIAAAPAEEPAFRGWPGRTVPPSEPELERTRWPICE